MTQSQNTIKHLRNQGFTLMEVLVAIGIFAIGMTALASLFPPALLLQKQTVRAMESDIFANNIEAMIALEGLDSHQDLGGNAIEDSTGWERYDATPNIPSQVWPLMSSDASLQPTQQWDPGQHPIYDRWSLDDRSYGSHIPLEDRVLFWVPLIQDTNEEAGKFLWRGYFFVVVGSGAADRAYESITTGPNALGDADANGSGIHTASPSAFSDPVRGDYEPTGGPTASDRLLPAVPRVMRLQVSTGGSNRFDFDNNPRLIRPGEQVVDNLGTVYTVYKADNNGIQIRGVVSANPTHLWYAAPHEPGGSSTFGALVVMNLGTDKDVLKP